MEANYAIKPAPEGSASGLTSDLDSEAIDFRVASECCGPKEKVSSSRVTVKSADLGICEILPAKKRIGQHRENFPAFGRGTSRLRK